LNDVVNCAKLAGYYWLGRDRQAEIIKWKVCGVYSLEDLEFLARRSHLLATHLGGIH
jgi:hypothetical protein